MKKHFLLLGVCAIIACSLFFISSSKKMESMEFLFDSIESLAADESGGPYSCTASTTCYNIIGQEDGSVSCSGNVCSRGSDWSGNRWVECDGHRTSC